MTRSSLASPRSQRGGTFLGFILGLVTGLAVAVGVALFITKAPVPFVSRPPVKTPDQTGAPPDPNRGFYPRDNGMPAATMPPGQPAAGSTSTPAATAQPNPPAATTPPAGQSAGAQGDKPFSFYELMPGRKPGETPAAPTGAAAGTPQPPAAVATARLAPTVPAPAANAPAPSAATPTAPGAIAIPATPGAATPAAVPAAENRYLLQAGAFRSEADADAMRARLALLGYEARVSPREGVGDPIYRVRIGPVVKLDDLNRMRQTLAQNGIDASVVRAP